ncbi:cell wall protein [Microbacterium sp. NPDC076911]|uniref:cell wall protein n=1 Tax=Microbacterium sp. NPDC076911 TaxID=3154958 RepID=UPI003448D6C7
MTTTFATRITRLSAGAMLAASLTVAAPLAAQASTIYPPAESCTTATGTVQAGGGFQFGCNDATFSPNESVTITVTGENGAGATIGMVRTAVTTASGQVTSDASGALPAVTITLPTDATGIYNIAAVSATSAGATASVTVTTGTDGLPVTGFDSGTLTGLWIGGGALVLAGAAVGVTALVRRRQSDD